MTPMALGLFSALSLVRWFDADGALMDLEPYLPGPRATGLGAILEDALMAHASWLRPFLFGVLGVMVFVGLDGLIRRTFRQAHEAGALLGTALLLLLPGQSALFVTKGGAALLLGCGATALAVLLSLNRYAVGRLLAALFASMAVAIHPAFVCLVPCVAVASLIGRQEESAASRLFFAAAILLGAAVTLLVTAGLAPAPAIHESLSDRRWSDSLLLALAAPAYALEATPRSLLPTGYEVLSGSLPVWKGIGIWGLCLAIAAMTAGMLRATIAVLLAALAALAPLWTPQGIPGDRILALFPLVPLAGVFSLFLGVCRGNFGRDAFLGLTMGLLVMVGMQNYRRVDDSVGGNFLASRLVAFQLPRVALAPGVDVPAPHLEPDPARLVLAAHDISTKKTMADPLVFRYADATQLESFGSVVIDPTGLERLRRTVSQNPGSMPLDADASEQRLFEDLLPPLETLLAELRNDSVAADADAWYERVMARFTQAIPDMMEVVRAGSRHPRVIHWARGLSQLAGDLGSLATRLGDSHFAVPIHELSVALTANVRATGILAVELTHVGRFDEARPLIEEARRGIPASDALGAVVRGSLGRIHYGLGERQESLEELERAWSGLGGRGAQVLTQTIDRRTVDYWLIVEILSLRYELAKERDRTLVKQAEFDLQEALDHASGVGKTMVPTLAFSGRFAYLRGQREAARTALEGLMKLPRGNIRERGERVDHARFRVLGLKTLLLLLTPEETDLRSQVEAQLSLYDHSR
jgi:tetratricopeptide (TPR) repeat protein